ncbi:MAG: hypothetical protein AAGF47_06825 [Planctomycetota bacterium]
MRYGLFAAMIAAAGTAAAQDFSVTEIYVGISGPDGTEDWFEITNTGAGILDTGSLFYDDEDPFGPDADGGTLDSFLLQPGESAVFLIADAGDGFVVIPEFTDIWGSVANVGITNGGGGLSQNGDEINISTDDGVTFGLTVAFDDSFANTGATIDNVSGLTDSVLGVNGAFESNPFFNDSIGPGDGFTLIGSPGVIPAPASAALLGLGGLAAARRRR